MTCDEFVAGVENMVELLLEWPSRFQHTALDGTHRIREARHGAAMVADVGRDFGPSDRALPASADGGAAPSTPVVRAMIGDTLPSCGQLARSRWRAYALHTPRRDAS
jgi:hypothetical protein